MPEASSTEGGSAWPPGVIIEEEYSEDAEEA